MYYNTLYLHKGYLDSPIQEHLIGCNKYTQAYKHEESTHKRSVHTTFSGMTESQKTERLFLACIISEADDALLSKEIQGRRNGTI